MKEEILYPFVAIVGQDMMKLALILNVINPRLSGVLIRGEKGTGKSTAVRSLAHILPEIEVVKGCPFSCDPSDKENLCPFCMEILEKNGSLEVERRRVKVVELPLGATEDRVCGTLNIEEAIKKGERKFEPGVLAEANRGFLYIDEVNLLDDNLVDVILDAAAMGVNYVEREGISFSHPSRFILVGTMNPEEGELRPQLLDRFGLCVTVKGLSDINDRMEVVRRREEFENDPEGFVERWRGETEKLILSIERAKEILPKVKIDDRLLEKTIKRIVEMGVDGHRGDIITIRTAKTIAAYNGRDYVIDEDVETALKLSLPHRIRRSPLDEVSDI